MAPIEAVIGKLFEKWLIIALIHKVRKYQLIYLVFIVRQIFEAGSTLSDSNNPEGGSPVQKCSIVLETASLSAPKLHNIAIRALQKATRYPLVQVGSSI